jgi:hypothetical protein
MIAKILKLVKNDAGPSDTTEERVYGRLVPPTVPSWSYPVSEQQRGKEEGERPVEEVRPPRLALLPGLQAEVLRPVRLGHDYVGGMIASLGVLTVGITLLLFQLMQN